MPAESDAKIGREKIIGGSDIAAVMGLNRWKSPLHLWALKTGKLVDDPLANFEAKEIGTELEEFVAKKFSRKTGLSVRRAPEEYVNPKYPYMVCHLDRLVLDGRAVLECKTTSAWNAKEWDGEDIPKEYVLQVMWQLGLTKREVGWIAVLIGGQKFLYKQITFDGQLYERMVEEARRFWEDFVLTGVAPMATSSDQEILAFIYKENQESSRQLTESDEAELETLLRDMEEAKHQVDWKQVEVDASEARIKQILGEASKIETLSWNVSWKTQERKVADVARLKSDGVFEKYSRTLESRVLRAEAKKGEQT